MKNFFSKMWAFIVKNKIASIVVASVLVVGVTCAIALPIALKHEHNYAKTWSHDAVNHYHECECGEKQDITAHTWNEGVITTQATFTQDGVKTFTCSQCNATKTEKVEFDCTDVAFEKSSVKNKTYTEIEITNDTIGTYYFEYNVSDVPADSEYYWINVFKDGLKQSDLSNCKIYDVNKQLIKENIATSGAGQYMAVQSSSDSSETLAKLRADGKHYFQMTFHTAGIYKIHVTHYPILGSRPSAAFEMSVDEYETTFYSNNKVTIGADTTRWFVLDLPQSAIEALGSESACLDGCFDSDKNATGWIKTVVIKVYNSDMEELVNTNAVVGEGEEPTYDAFDIENITEGKYYICVTNTSDANISGYLCAMTC